MGEIERWLFLVPSPCCQPQHCALLQPCGPALPCSATSAGPVRGWALLISTATISSYRYAWCTSLKCISANQLCRVDGRATSAAQRELARALVHISNPPSALPCRTATRSRNWQSFSRCRRAAPLPLRQAPPLQRSAPLTHSVPWMPTTARLWWQRRQLSQLEAMLLLTAG